jgi:phosphoglycolate phosphatase
MKFDLIVFDWDGTLCDSTALIVQAMQSAAADVGLPIPSKKTASYVIGLGLADAVQIAVPTLKPAQMPAFLAAYKKHYLLREAELTLFDGIRGMLEQLRMNAQVLAVATGKSRLGLDRSLIQGQLGGFFKATRCADEGFSKPNPWMLTDLGDQLLIEPRAMLMIGDTSHDRLMAENAGSSFVGVTYGAHAADELGGPKTLGVFDEVAELHEFLTRLE